MNEWTRLRKCAHDPYQKAINLVHKYSYVWYIVEIWTVKIKKKKKRRNSAKNMQLKPKLQLAFLEWNQHFKYSLRIE